MTMTGKNVSCCYFVHHISNIAWLGIELGFISKLRFVSRYSVVITDLIYGADVI